MRKRISAFLPPVILIGLFIGWSVLIFHVPPASIIERIGISNGYAAAFILAFLGGLSAFISFPYYLGILTLGAGGLEPVFLGIAAAGGLFLGDSTSYLIGYTGRDIIPSRLHRVFDRFCSWCLSHPSWLVPTVLFLYGALVPFSNDLLVVPMGLARFPFWRLMIPLSLGNVVFNTGVALIGAYGGSALFF